MGITVKDGKIEGVSPRCAGIIRVLYAGMETLVKAGTFSYSPAERAVTLALSDHNLYCYYGDTALTLDLLNRSIRFDVEGSFSLAYTMGSTVFGADVMQDALRETFTAFAVQELTVAAIRDCAGTIPGMAKVYLTHGKSPRIMAAFFVKVSSTHGDVPPFGDDPERMVH